ncbi:hypothetical protein VMCG_03492 [Cytospora schulzeri]|uniref:HMG box domain-containing protein n=1 Tax=Cytospora schulzeri TaxID=448051 RepID=A0A423WW33_9PEZI|nr:hypothetical protein VMCG_03492 [Valsa malicola]
MARPKKADEQKQLAPAAPPAPPSMPNMANMAMVNHQNKVIDVDNFIRVRDSVYQRLATIQDLIRSFSADYLRQTNLLIGEPTLLEDGADVGIAQLGDMFNFQPMPQVPGIPLPPVEEKKERKKRQHDPDAPKRPLTPYFLYMQTARPIIAADLGDSVPKRAVQDEGQRRWASMSAQEKLGWNQAYQYNLRLYNARVHSYKAGNPNAKNMSDEEAVRYCEEFSIPMPHVGGVDSELANDQDAIAEQLQESVPIPEPVEEPTTKASKPKASRKRKGDAEPVQPVVAPAAPAPSPDKKRKRTSTKPVEQPEKDEPKKTGRKKAKSG